MGESLDQVIQAGVQAEESGDLQTALSHYNRAVQMAPTDEKLIMLRAAALSELGRDEEALEDFNSIVSRDPRHAPALWGRGTVLRKLKRFDESEADLQQAIQLQPLAVYYVELANTYIETNKATEAVDALNAAIQIGLKDPKKQGEISVMALRTKAQIFRAVGRDGADEMEKKAVEIETVVRRMKSGGGGGGAAAANTNKGCGRQAAALILICLLPYFLH